MIATPPPQWTIVIYDIAAAAAALALARRRTTVAVALLTGASALCLWPPRAASHGLVVTAIQGRDYARIYMKELDRGRASVALSPEEQEAVERARRNAA